MQALLLLSRGGNQHLLHPNMFLGWRGGLKHHGIELEGKIVLDPQNENYPVPVTRNLGGLAIREITMVPYPPFVDIRAGGMKADGGITSGIPQVTLNWPSPITIDQGEEQ